MTENTLLYSFENIEVYKRELFIVLTNQWVNDTIVHLAGRKLELKANQGLDKDKPSVMFIPPQTIQFFRFFPPDVAKTAIPNFNIFKAEIALFPFVDASSPMDTGTHWSLLVWHTKGSKNEPQIIEYLDSHGGYNTETAKKLVEILTNLYEITDYKLEFSQVPQQNNGFDCGMFVIAFMKHYCEHKSIDGIFDDVSQEKVTEMRKTYQQDYMT